MRCRARQGTGTVLGLVTALTVGATAAACPATPSSVVSGTAGVGDPLYPTLGNGGYDVTHYHLDLRYHTSTAPEPVTGTVTLDARALATLSRFNLDFAGDGVSGVEVDGRPARWLRLGQELVITPPQPLPAGKPFRVRVSDFSATPVAPDPGAVFPAPLVFTPDGLVVAAQPDGAHAIFPCNDHPSDPASFTFRIEAPPGTVAVANGVLTGRRTDADSTTWWYRHRQPMPTELVQLAVGDFEVIRTPSRNGLVRRDVAPARLSAELAAATGATGEHLEWLQDQLGRYPFDAYGSVIVDAGLNFALETQTLPLYDASLFRRSPALWNSLLVHELAHHWFGNLVTPRTWSDVWLNEGYASWYEFSYADERKYLADRDYIGIRDLEALMQLVYAYGDRWRERYGPVARPRGGATLELFNVNVYYGGAMVLYALRQELGPAAFDRLQRVWPQRFRGGPASTDDFIATASEVTGRDLGGFLTAWLYGTTTPPMPGHPDWTVLPVETATNPAVVETTDVETTDVETTDVETTDVDVPQASGANAPEEEDPLTAGFRSRFHG